MPKNILNELKMLYNEIIMRDKASLDGMYMPYKKETREIFWKVLGYVKEADWTNTPTAKFVAQNFTLGQTNLAGAWKRRYPSRPEKADSTMRT